MPFHQPDRYVEQSRGRAGWYYGDENWTYDDRDWDYLDKD